MRPILQSLRLAFESQDKGRSASRGAFNLNGGMVSVGDGRDDGEPKPRTLPPRSGPSPEPFEHLLALLFGDARTMVDHPHASVG